MSIFDSRWVEVPDGARELEGGLPAGFAAGGTSAGLKPSGALDVGLLLGEGRDVTSAARFTRSGVQAAPVQVTRERCNLADINAVVVNSGNANAATGQAGYAAAVAVQDTAASALGLQPAQVAVCSTGVIGVPLDPVPVEQAVKELAGTIDATGDVAFQQAIMTTDAFEKRASIEVTLSGGEVWISAQAKGAGMIQPSFATMLCFVETDARLSEETADLLLGVTVKRSFDRISVDGQLSTNDTVIFMASGDSGVAVEPESQDEKVFGRALDELMRALALAIVRDGEGAERVGRVLVRGGHGASVERVARAVANSPLVKTALHGGDPNWGRIAQAAGMVVPDSAPLPVDVAIEGVQLCVAGEAVPYDESELASRVAAAEVEYTVGLPGDGHEAECFFSDLGHEYIRINAEYTT